MKKTITMAALCFAGLLAGQAQASYYQVYCSTADTTLTQANGHRDNYFHATKRTFEGGEAKIEQVSIEGAQVENLKETKLEDEKVTHCEGGHGGGYATWRDVTHAKIRVTMPDGSLFDKDIVGVTADLKAIEVSWICELNGNSRVFCPEE